MQNSFQTLVKISSLKKSVKVNKTFGALFSLEENKSFDTKNQCSNLSNLFDENIRDKLVKIIEEFQERDFGWTLKQINYLNINVF